MGFNVVYMRIWLLLLIQTSISRKRIKKLFASSVYFHKNDYSFMKKFCLIVESVSSHDSHMPVIIMWKLWKKKKKIKWDKYKKLVVYRLKKVAELLYKSCL